MAIDGAKVLVLVNTGTNFVAVGEQTELSAESTVNLIEVTSKDSEHTQWIYGVSDGTVDLSAMYVPDDAAMEALRTAQKNKTEVKIRRSLDGEAVEEADALIESISDTWPNNDASTTEVSFQLNSDWTEVSV